MMHKILFLVCFLSLGLPAHAWREGNGGDGVKVGDRIYLLDLVEAGHEQLQIPTGDYDSSFLKKEVQALSQKMAQPIPEKMIFAKLAEISQKNQVLALALLAGFQKLQWNWVSFPLKDLKDEGNKLDIPRDLLVQLALRVNQTIQIQRQTWDLMDDRNKTALLFHEVIYALMVPTRTAEGIDLNSPKVRTLVAFLFSKNFANEPLNLILTTEAPHLSFPTTLDLKLQPSWSVDKSSLLLNRRWVAEMQIDSLERIERLKFEAPEVPSWLQNQCKNAVESKRQFILGLQADTLRTDFREMGIQDQEEFYLAPTFAWETRLQSVVIEASSESDCLKKAQDGMNSIKLQTIWSL